MSDCRFGISPVNYPDPDPKVKLWVLLWSRVVSAQSRFDPELT